MAAPCSEARAHGMAVSKATKDAISGLVHIQHVSGAARMPARCKRCLGTAGHAGTPHATAGARAILRMTAIHPLGDSKPIRTSNSPVHACMGTRAERCLHACCSCSEGSGGKRQRKEKESATSSQMCTRFSYIRMNINRHMSAIPRTYSAALACQSHNMHAENSQNLHLCSDRTRTRTRTRTTCALGPDQVCSQTGPGRDQQMPACLYIIMQHGLIRPCCSAQHLGNFPGDLPARAAGCSMLHACRALRTACML
jgi:hypothetical protein